VKFDLDADYGPFVNAPTPAGSTTIGSAPRSPISSPPRVNDSYNSRTDITPSDCGYAVGRRHAGTLLYAVLRPVPTLATGTGRSRYNGPAQR
jgi:hypothetical protein